MEHGGRAPPRAKAQMGRRGGAHAGASHGQGQQVGPAGACAERRSGGRERGAGGAHAAGRRGDRGEDQSGAAGDRCCPSSGSLQDGTGERVYLYGNRKETAASVWVLTGARDRLYTPVGSAYPPLCNARAGSGCYTCGGMPGGCWDGELSAPDLVLGAGGLRPQSYRLGWPAVPTPWTQHETGSAP